MRETHASNWTEALVADVIERHFSGPSPDCEERPIFHDDEWGVLKTTAVTWSGWNQEAHKVLPREYWGQADIEVQADDVLVTKAGPRQRVAVVAHIPSTRPKLVVSGKMIALRPRRDVVRPEVLGGLLALTAPQKYIQDRTTGMAESQVNFANQVLLNTPLLVPPMLEQRAIVRVVNALDTTIRQTEAIIAKLKLVKQGLLHDLLTRGIDANGELRPPQSEAPDLYKASPLGWIPLDWMCIATDELADAPICYGIVQVLAHVPNGISVLAIKDLLGDYSTGVHRTARSIDAAYARSRVIPGDVLVSIKGTIGRIGVVPPQYVGNISRDIARIRPNSNVVRAEFLAQLLRSPKGQQTLGFAQVGSTRAELSIAPLRRLVHALPPIDEQALIEKEMARIDSQLEAEQRAVSKFKELKSGLIDDLLTGRVRVTPLLTQSATT